jgi:hypothetical protein
MIDIKKRISSTPRNPRTYFAVGLIIFSFFAALAITAQAHQTTIVWAANSDLPVGHTLASQDMKTMKVLLPDNFNHYYSDNTKIVGSIVRHAIGASDLIPFSSLTQSRGGEILQSLPMHVSRNDLPNDLLLGQRVDLYAMPLNSSVAPFDPLMIASHVPIESIDQKSKELGGDIGVVLSLPESSILNVVSYLFDSRIVVVRDAF